METVAAGLGGVILACALLPLLLVAYHAAVYRWFRVPPPLVARTRPLTAMRALVVALVGATLCYLVPVALFVPYAADAGIPDGTALNPVSGGPAEKAGLRSGDRALAIDEHPVATFEQLRTRVMAGGDRVALRYEREGEVRSVTIEKNDQGMIGVQSARRKLSLVEALPEAFVMPARVVAYRLYDDAAQMSGPVAIVSTNARDAQRQFLAFFAVLLSLNLGTLYLCYGLAVVLDLRARANYQARLARQTM